MESLTRRQFGLASTAIVSGIPRPNETSGSSSFGQRLRQSREARGLAVEQCCQVIADRGSEAETDDWCRWESNESEPDFLQGLLAAELLGVDVGWLAFGEAA